MVEFGCSCLLVVFFFFFKSSLGQGTVGAALGFWAYPALSSGDHDVQPSPVLRTHQPRGHYSTFSHALQPGLQTEGLKLSVLSVLEF